MTEQPTESRIQSPVKWNMIYDVTGRVWEDLDAALAKSGVVLVDTEDDLDGVHLGEDDEVLRPTMLKIGFPMPIFYMEKLLDGLRATWGTDNVGFGPLGFHPLPYSTEGWVKRGGITGVGHPVFWLPEESVGVFRSILQDPRFEDWGDVIVHIAIWQQIEACGFGDSQTGMVSDFLVANGIDPQEPPWQNLVRSTRDTHEDLPGFARDLKLPLPEDVPSAEVLAWWSATVAADICRGLFDVYVERQVSWANAELGAHCYILDELDVPVLMAPYEEGGRQYAQEPNQETWDRLMEGVDFTVDDIMGVASEAIWISEAARLKAEGRVPVSDGVPAGEESKRALDEMDELAARAKSILAGSKDRSDVSQALTDAWNELATAAHRSLQRAQEVESKATMWRVNDYRISPPPPLEVPLAVRAEVERIRRASQDIAGQYQQA